MSNNNPYLPTHQGNYYPISFTCLPYDMLLIENAAIPPVRYTLPVLSPRPIRLSQNFSTTRSQITKPLNASEATIKKIQELIIGLKLTGTINGELLVDTWCTNFKNLSHLPVDKIIGKAREITKALKDSLPENFNNFIETLPTLITLFHNDSILLTCKLIQLQEKHPQIRCHALDSIIEKILNEYHASSHSGRGLAYLKKSISEYVIYLLANQDFFHARKILNTAVESKLFKQCDPYYTEALNKYIFQLNAYEGNYPIDTGSVLNKILSPEIVYNEEWAKIFKLSLLVAEKLLTPSPLATTLPLSIITEVFDKTREDRGKAIGIMVLVKLANLPLSKTQDNALNNLLAPHREETVTRRLEISETDYVQCIDSTPPKNQLITYCNLIKFHSRNNNLDLTLFYIKHLLSVKNSFPNFEAQRSYVQDLFFTSINRFLEKPTTETTHCYTISTIYSLLSCKSFLNIFDSKNDQKMQLIYNAIILALSNKSHRIKNEITELTAIFFSESNIENTKFELKNFHVLAQKLPKLVLFEALMKSKPTNNNEILINLTQEACVKLNANNHYAKAIDLAEHYNIYTLELAQEFLKSGSYYNNTTQYSYSWRYFLNTLDRNKNNSSTENILLYNCWNKALINLRRFDARQLKDTINTNLHLDKILSLNIELAKKEHLLIHLTRIYLEASKQSKNNKIYLKKAIDIRSQISNENISCNVLNLDCDLINHCGVKIDREFLTTLIPLIINVTNNFENSSQLLKFKAVINNVCKGVGNNIYTSEDLSLVMPFIEGVMNTPRTIKVSFILENLSKSNNQICQQACITTIEKIIKSYKSHKNLIKPIKDAIFISLERVIATKDPTLLIITAKLLSHTWFSTGRQVKKRDVLLKDATSLITNYLLSNSPILDVTIPMLNYLNSLTKFDFMKSTSHQYQLLHTAIQMRTLDLIVNKIQNDRELAANYIEHFISLTESLPKKTLQGVVATCTLNNALNATRRLEESSKAKLQQYILAKLTDTNIKFLFDKKLLTADLCNTLLEHIKDNYENYPSHPIVLYQLITFFLKTEESLKVKVNSFMKFAFLLPSEGDRAIHEHKQLCLAIFTRIFTLFNSDFDDNDRIQLGLIFTFLMEKISSGISREKHLLKLTVKDPAATVFTIIEKILENPSNAAKHFAIIFLISIEVDSFLKNSIDLLPSYKMLINYVKDDALVDLSQETAPIPTLSLREIATEFCSNLGYREKYKTDSCPKALASINSLIVDNYMCAIRKSINGTYLTWITNIEYLKNFITTVNQFNIIHDNAKNFRKNMCNLLSLSSSKKSLKHYLLYFHVAKGLCNGIIMSAETEPDIKYIAARFIQYISQLCKKTTNIDDVLLLKNLFLHIKDSFVKIPPKALKKLHKMCLREVHRVEEYKHFKNIEDMRQL